MNTKTVWEAEIQFFKKNFTYTFYHSVIINIKTVKYILSFPRKLPQHQYNYYSSFVFLRFPSHTLTLSLLCLDNKSDHSRSYSL